MARESSFRVVNMRNDKGSLKQGDNVTVHGSPHRVLFRQTNIAIDSIDDGLYPFLTYLSMIDEANRLTRKST